MSMCGNFDNPERFVSYPNPPVPLKNEACIEMNFYGLTHQFEICKLITFNIPRTKYEQGPHFNTSISNLSPYIPSVKHECTKL